MRNIFLAGVFLFGTVSSLATFAQSITGKWKTIDDESGDERSIVEIYQKGDKYFGRLIRLFPKKGTDPDPVCSACPTDDERHNKKVIGMDIIRNMEQDDDAYSGGDILDPKVGKVYKCRIWLEDGDLKVRGYWGLFYRTQTWKRMN